MQLLFLFLDGVGLGDDDPTCNPFSAADLPTLSSLAGQQRWLTGATAHRTDRVAFIPTDATLGVPKKPQSATGQATILTGINVPAQIGRHYGPKPTPDIGSLVEKHSVVKRLRESGISSQLLNVYSSSYLDQIARGKLLHTSNQLAFTSAGVPMRDGQAYLDGTGISADFTGEMWVEYGARHDQRTLDYQHHQPDKPIPTYSPGEAGRLLANTAQEKRFSFFDNWLTDYLGHRGKLPEAIRLAERFDAVMASLLEHWDDNHYILITSDHGNFEDLSQRGHTRNRVPTVLIGPQAGEITADIRDLTHITPLIQRIFGI